MTGESLVELEPTVREVRRRLEGSCKEGRAYVVRQDYIYVELYSESPANPVPGIGKTSPRFRQCTQKYKASEGYRAYPESWRIYSLIGRP